MAQAAQIDRLAVFFPGTMEKDRVERFPPLAAAGLGAQEKMRKAPLLCRPGMRAAELQNSMAREKMLCLAPLQEPVKRRAAHYWPGRPLQLRLERQPD